MKSCYSTQNCNKYYFDEKKLMILCKECVTYKIERMTSEIFSNSIKQLILLFFKNNYLQSENLNKQKIFKNTYFDLDSHLKNVKSIPKNSNKSSNCLFCHLGKI